MQTHTVFANVSKGQVAKKEDLIKAFGKADQTDICKEILAKGELQVSDKERHSQIDQMFKEIATTVAMKCINPEVQRPYPVSIIEKAMKNAHYSVKVNQSTKQQAVQVIKLLKESIPIERIRMRLKASFKGKAAKIIKDKLSKMETIEIEKEDRQDDEITLVFLIEPGQFKDIDTMIKEQSKGTALMEVIDSKVVVEGEELL